MAETLDKAAVDMFDGNVIHLAQQLMSRFRMHVDERHIQAKTYEWERLDEEDTVEKTASRVSTPQNDPTWSNRQSTVKTYHQGNTVEQDVLAQVLVDAKSAQAVNLARGMARRVDDVIIGAIGGASRTGEGTAVAFPTGQVVGGATSLLTIPLLLEASQKFAESDVDDMTGLCWAFAPRQSTRMMSTLEVTSKDFQDAQEGGTPLSSGKFTKFLGFTLIPTNRLNVPAVGQIDNLIWAPEAIGFHVAKDMWTRVEERADQSFLWQLYAAMTMGAVRLEDEKVVKLHLKDAVA